MTRFTNPLKSVSLNVSDTFSAPAPFLLQDMHVQKSKTHWNNASFPKILTYSNFPAQTRQVKQLAWALVPLRSYSHPQHLLF